MDTIGSGPHAEHTDACTVDGCIPASAFPSTRDQLLVAVVRHHAKSSLLWELSRLPDGRTFQSPQDVDEALGQSRQVVTPREPW